jgi:DNA polymerase-3 subunit delta'
MIENWNVLGHAWAVDMLRQHIVHDSVRHAYLVAGPPGVGRRTLALRFAQALNCTQPVEPGIPCGSRCRDCQQIDAMRHPDLTVVQADTEGGTLKVDQVREARRLLGLKPYQSKYRVALFLRFQEANDSASNALLKTLEEAPSYAVLILTADSAEGLLPTIVSRCEALRLQPHPLEGVAAFLRQAGAAEERSRLIAHISGGRPGLALRLLHEPSALEYRAEKLSELESLLGATRAQKFAYAEQLGKDKAAMRGVLRFWLSFWRDVMWRASGAATPLTNIDREQRIDTLAQRIGLPAARRLVSDLERAVGRLEASVNPRLLAEVLLLDWPK